MWRADAELNHVCGSIPTGAAAYHHDVYAAHLLNSVLR
ncbi:hypothetical protein T01_11518 [Trichinella spiralis]|uniref:Uncharacterized protein n=1 Tax=Trichinella spiralis TaxID=6334 RepID=A0A0V0ZGB0_TRISP|nr:hypothetical protein T01_3309 [Trichinella spiralis]KRY11524.1 hypothetical protein T01_11518 [Trichinella spiralis]